MDRKKICITLILIDTACILTIFLLLNTTISFGMFPLLCLIILLITSIFGLVRSMVGFSKNIVVSIVLLLTSVVGFFIIYSALTYQQPRPKSETAFIKAALANSRAQAEILFEETNPHSYQSVCNDPVVLAQLAIAKKSSKNNPKCFSDYDSFVITGEFKKPVYQTTHYCVDSNKSSKNITSLQNAAIINSNTLCP